MADNNLLEPKQVEKELAKLNSDWKQEGKYIRREIKSDDFNSALELANRIGQLADNQDHHPELLVEWGKLGVSITTHDASGLTQKDFDLALSIDELT